MNNRGGYSLINFSNVSNVKNSFNTVIDSVGNNAVTVVNTSKDGRFTFTQTVNKGGGTGTTSFPSDKYDTTVIIINDEDEGDACRQIPDEIKDESTVIEENEDSCSICMERSIKTVIIDCGHQVYCVTCARNHVKKDSTCPICRKMIKKGVIRFYK